MPPLADAMSDQQPAPVAEAPAPQPRRSIWRLPIAIIARYIQLLQRRRLVGCLVGLIGLLFICGATSWVMSLVVSPMEEPLTELHMAPVNDTATLMITPEDAVSQYIAGMTQFDGQRMWDAYAEIARSGMAASGRSAAELQRGLDEARTRGARIESTQALGSYPLRDGRRFVFYIVRRSGFPPDGSSEELYFVFTVDPAGKILDIV